MRIGIEAQRIFRAKKHGMDIVALNLIKALQKLDTVNQYYIFTNEQEDVSCLKETDNFKIIRSSALLYPIWEQVVLPQWVRHFQLDVLHCTSNTAPLYVQVPMVLTLHDIIYLENNPLEMKGTPYQKWGNYYRSKIVPLVLEKASKVFTVSNFEKDRISDFLHLDAEKLEAVYNGVSQHFFTPASHVNIKVAQVKYNLPKNYIFFLGNTDPKKNLARTLQAYEIYRENVDNPLPLVIADFSKEKLYRMQEQIGLSPETLTSIHLIGYVPNVDLPVLYQLASMFLYTSVRESFGIPILEAMASGTAVITSNTASMPEVAGDAALLASPFDSKDIAKQMIALDTFPERKAELIAKGKERALNFKWEQTAIKTLETYHMLAGVPVTASHETAQPSSTESTIRLAS